MNRRHLLQTFSGVDVKHQFRARAPGPPCVTAPVTTTVLPRLLLQYSGGKTQMRRQANFAALAQAPSELIQTYMVHRTGVLFGRAMSYQISESKDSRHALSSCRQGAGGKPYKLTTGRVSHCGM
jgi:hypothetical protein